MGINSHIYLGEGIMVYTSYMTPSEKKLWQTLLDELADLYQDGVHYDAYEDGEEVLLGYKNLVQEDYDRTPDLLSKEWKEGKHSAPINGRPGEWSEFAAAADEEYYGQGEIAAFPALFAIIAGGPDSSWPNVKRRKIITDYLAFLREKNILEKSITALERLLLTPRISLPAVWLANYYF